jgi:hypothetical protein
MRNYLFIFLLLTACQTKPVETYTPPKIVDTQPSWDGFEQNSGLIDYIDGKGFLITKGAAYRYRFLTKTLGSTLTPPIQEGEGLIPDGENFILSPEHMTIFMELSELNKLK